MNANHRESTQKQALSLRLFAAFCGDWRSFAANLMSLAYFVANEDMGASVGKGYSGQSLENGLR